MVNLSPFDQATIISISIAAGYFTRYTIELLKNKYGSERFKPEDKPERWDG